MAVRKFTSFIFITIVSCCIGIVICAVSVGTDFWFHGSAKEVNELTVELRFGLFKGTKTITASTQNSVTYDLKIVCVDGFCMFSCGSTSEYREIDMKNVRNNGLWSNTVCINGAIDGVRPEHVVQDSDFLRIGYWLTTIIFISFAILFFAIGGALALYNTFRTPIQPIFSVFGLYIWNGIAAGCIFLALLIWGISFGNTLKKNPNVSETLNGPLQDEIHGSLGFSFWILILAVILPLINIGLLRFRSWKIAKLETVIHQTIDAKLTSGDVLLF